MNLALDSLEKSVVEPLQSAAIELVDESLSEYPEKDSKNKKNLRGSVESSNSLGGSSASLQPHASGTQSDNIYPASWMHNAGKSNINNKTDGSRFHVINTN